MGNFSSIVTESGLNIVTYAFAFQFAYRNGLLNAPENEPKRARHGRKYKFIK